ncbi:dehydratase [Intrasporangium chromatireducens Q5-1]|uniref:Dehydratase n=1 Tax=Intrasporangium chromatireducens Q5-1 TaxID=584657 RepID=W9GJK3_9MICO|nr:MaoC family dehydratase [Intrasporangium chromatireducens]EWT06280.1 dehydratase [Intrasporangium chromatireducens Q5-1]
MTQRVFRSVPDLEAAVGEELGPTDWVEITQDTVDGFADLTGDHQWIHVDVDRARTSPFGGTIAHGYLTLSMLPSFSTSLYSIKAGTARLNYGLEKVRFPASVLVGSKVRATATIKQIRQVSAGTQVRVGWTVEADGVARPVCVAESITLVVP